MPPCVRILIEFWLGLTPWWQDRLETLEARTALYQPVAEVVCASTENQLERAMLGAQAYFEGSRLGRYVLEDRCKDGPRSARCDNGLATGPWQVHGWCRDAWVRPFTPENRAARWEAGADCTLLGARAGRRACGGLRGMFAYQQGPSCAGNWTARVSMATRLWVNLQKEP